jgi:hydrophobic/amphiphilic exporter-1 (mainly G- bacteria), HAE1 family
MISRFFIDRPVLANVLAIVLVLLGLVALSGLPVSQYPNVVPPTVQVTTRYPGASAQTVIDTVAQPIEQQVNGVEDMLYMQSTSASDGTYTLTVTFAIGTDLNFAQVLVQNRVSSALASLPQPVQAQGLTVQKQSTAILEIITLTGSNPRQDSLYLSNYATINLHDELARVPGVGNVTVFGAGQYAMRIWLDPNQLQTRGLTPSDVISALQQQSQQVTAGQVGMPPVENGQAFQYTVNVAGRLQDVEQFANVVVKVDPDTEGRITRVRDVGRVELGAQTYSQAFTLNGEQAAGLAIYQLSGANALDVATAVGARMGELARSFPQGLQYSVPFNTTLFVRASINEVYTTLGEAGILVLVVILVFLQDWRATLVPATTVPVTIIGAFAAMAALGFTINLSTLFAVVLAIGIVVDDAIVVVEGATRHIEAGLSPRAAAGRAMDELFGPIMGITLVLMSVFLPAAFLPGLTGRMFAQFALVIAATAAISALNAATLKPTQCATWLRAPVPLEKRNGFYRGFNRTYAAVERRYIGLIQRLVAHSGLTVVGTLILVGLGGWGLMRLPTGFLPTEDQGFMIIATQLPDGAALDRTQRVLEHIGTIARGVPGVDQVINIAGLSAVDNNASLANAGVTYVILKDWSQRGAGQDLRSIYDNLNAALAPVEEAQALVLPPPPIQGIGNANGFTMQLELRDGSADYARLQATAREVIAHSNTQSGLARVATSFRAEVPQITVTVDRIKAESLHVQVGDIFQALAAYLGPRYVNQFNRFGHTFQLYVQAESKFRVRPEDIEQLYVRGSDNHMVPLGTLVSIKPAVGPSVVSLYNLYPAATVIGTPAPGFSSGEALNLMDQLTGQTLPPSMGAEWTAMSYQERAVGNQLTLALLLAVGLVYLVLAGQYESWILPVAVIFGVPLALLGPVVALTALGLANNLYTQIGLMLLIALAAKNAILIVEVARDLRLSEGRPILEAATEAARLRFRPILMTSFAFILGMLPLMLATGAGANARRSIGLTALTGMLASTGLAVLLVPAAFVVLQRFDEWRAARRNTITSAIAE